MLTKKQCLFMFITTMVVFIGAFSFFYRNMNRNVVTSENTQEHTLEEIKQETSPVNEENVTDLAKQEDLQIILPTTKIDMNIVDSEDNILSVAQVDPISLLNLSKEDLESRFLGYDIVEFSSDKVSLKKTIEQDETTKEYRLGTKDDKVCIVTYDKNSHTKEYISLDLSVQAISAHLYNQLLTEHIVLTKEQKDILKESPYYIEEILQNIEE